MWGNNCFQLQESKLIVLIRISFQYEESPVSDQLSYFAFYHVQQQWNTVQLLVVVLCCDIEIKCFITLQQFLFSDYIFRSISAEKKSQGFVSHFLKWFWKENTSELVTKLWRKHFLVSILCSSGAFPRTRSSNCLVTGKSKGIVWKNSVSSWCITKECWGILEYRDFGPYEFLSVCMKSLLMTLAN